MCEETFSETSDAATSYQQVKFAQFFCEMQQQSDLLQSVGSTAKVRQGIQDVSIYTDTYVHAYFSKGVKVIKVKSRFFLTMTAKIGASGAHSGPRRFFRVVNKVCLGARPRKTIVTQTSN